MLAQLIAQLPTHSFGMHRFSLSADPCVTLAGNNQHYFDVGFSYCWINLEVLKYSLEQYIGLVVRQAFICYCGLHQVWLEAEN